MGRGQALCADRPAALTAPRRKHVSGRRLCLVPCHPPDKALICLGFFARPSSSRT